MAEEKGIDPEPKYDDELQSYLDDILEPREGHLEEGKLPEWRYPHEVRQILFTLNNAHNSPRDHGGNRMGEYIETTLREVLKKYPDQSELVESMIKPQEGRHMDNLTKFYDIIFPEEK